MPHIPVLLCTALLLLSATPLQARQDPGPVRAEVGRFLDLQSRSLPGEVRVQVGEFNGITEGDMDELIGALSAEHQADLLASLGDDN